MNKNRNRVWIKKVGRERKREREEIERERERERREFDNKKR